MKIVKQPKKRYITYQEYIKKCPRCKCKFIFKEGNVYRGLLLSFVECPSCGQQIEYFFDKVYKKHYSDEVEQ